MSSNRVIDSQEEDHNKHEEVIEKSSHNGDDLKGQEEDDGGKEKSEVDNSENEVDSESETENEVDSESETSVSYDSDQNFGKYYDWLGGTHGSDDDSDDRSRSNCSSTASVHDISELSSWSETNEQFFEAVDSDDVTEVQRILNTERVDVNARDRRGYTALYYACHNADIETVTLLSRYGADINIPCCEHSEQKPLHIAAQSRFGLDVVKYLLDNGTRIDDQDKHGNTPLHLACQRGAFSVVELIVNKQPSCVNIENNHRRIPLHHACRQGRMYIVQYLVEKMNIVDVVSEDEYGYEPEDLASMRNHDDIVEFLIQERQRRIRSEAYNWFLIKKYEDECWNNNKDRKHDFGQDHASDGKSKVDSFTNINKRQKTM